MSAARTRTPVVTPSPNVRGAELQAELQALKDHVTYLQAALRETIRQRGPGRSEKCFTCRQQFTIYPGDTPKYMLPHGGMPVCPDCWTEARVGDAGENGEAHHP